MFGLLQSIGAVSLMAVAGGSAWAARRWLRRFGRRFDALAPLPARLCLQPVTQSMRTFVGAGDLQRLGFVPVGSFTPAQLPRLRLALSLHPRGVVAMCWQDRRLGDWMDLWARTHDGRSVLVTSKQEAEGIPAPPWAEVICAPKADASALMALLDRSLGRRVLVPTNAEDLPQLLEQAWAAEMDWRNAAALQDEQLLLQGLPDMDPADAAQARDIMRRGALHGLDQALRARLSWSGPEESEDRLLFVHDLLLPNELELRMRELLGAPPGPLHAGAARAAFAAWNRRQSPEQRFEPLGEVLEPVLAEAWLAPPARGRLR